MSAVLSTRDALAKALNRPLAGVIPTEWTAVEGSEFLLMVADALIASGAVVDAATLADDEALTERWIKSMVIHQGSADLALLHDLHADLRITLAAALTERAEANEL